MSRRAPEALPATLPEQPARESETVQVRCHAGYRGQETPRAVVQEGRELEVLEILERWLEPGCRCFRIRTEGGVAVLIHEEAEDRWRFGQEPSSNARSPR